MSPDFEGRPVVITGGDGALGRAVVEAFRGAGAVCHLPVVGPAGGEEARPGVVVSPNLDLSDEASAVRYFAGLPPIAASVHLAGGFLARPIAETSLGDLERQLRINLFTTFLCCREAVKAFRNTAGGGGRIVNVAARVVEQPPAGMTAYTIAKSGVAALTRALAAEVRAEGILVNAVLPSIIDTPANRAAMPAADPARWPKPDELARTILWLASAENRLTSGALIPAYGNA